MILKRNRTSYLARQWSNKELKKFSHLFSGNVLNVSGASDSDKEGNKYKEYFINCSQYNISNIDGHYGYQGKKNEFKLDLEKELPHDLYKKFDVCFNHTTLEHIFDVNTAFKNICDMSNDIVIIIVPFSQFLHYSNDETWLDFWRFTPFVVENLFKINGFSTIYLNSNKNLFAAQYIFAIGTRNPYKWMDKHKELGYIDHNLNKDLYKTTKYKIFRSIFNIFKF